MTVHCLFEQSGTFKNAFKEFGYNAIDYDINDEFNQTDFIIDLFREIEAAYFDCDSIFTRDINKDDLIFAFFPCTRFECQVHMLFSGNASQQITWSDNNKIEYALKLHNELHKFYRYFCHLYLVCLKYNLKCIIENPYTQPHYLSRYFPIKPTIIDMDRRKNNDFFKKPTQYFFINIQPKQNVIFENLDCYDYKNIDKIHGINRSIISPEYAKRFIKQFIL